MNNSNPIISLTNGLILHLLSTNPEWEVVPTEDGRHLLVGGHASDDTQRLQEYRKIRKALDAYRNKELRGTFYLNYGNWANDQFDRLCCAFEIKDDRDELL